MKTIEITIAPNGATSIQTKGYSGTDCQAASRSLETALGVKTHEQRTAEYFQKASVQNQANAKADGDLTNGK